MEGLGGVSVTEIVVLVLVVIVFGIIYGVIIIYV